MILVSAQSLALASLGALLGASLGAPLGASPEVSPAAVEFGMLGAR